MGHCATYRHGKGAVYGITDGKRRKKISIIIFGEDSIGPQMHCNGDMMEAAMTVKQAKVFDSGN